MPAMMMLEDTGRFLDVEKDGVQIPCSVWKGQTGDGIYVECLIARIRIDREAQLKAATEERQT